MTREMIAEQAKVYREIAAQHASAGESALASTARQLAREWEAKLREPPPSETESKEVCAKGSKIAAVGVIRELIDACDKRFVSRVAADTGVDRETLMRVMRGEPIRPSSLKRIVDGLAAYRKS